MASKRVVIKKYHEDLWNNNRKIREAIENYLNSEEVARKSNARESKGATLTTARLDPSWMINIRELDPLLDWVGKELLSASYTIRGKKYKAIEFRRAWANKMFKNSSGDWHNHSFDGIVGIFYLNVPSNGARLLTKEMEFLNKTGDLLIHDGDFDHAVSTHLSEEPRIVLVFEALLVE